MDGFGNCVDYWVVGLFGANFGLLCGINVVYLWPLWSCLGISLVDNLVSVVCGGFVNIIGPGRLGVVLDLGF